MEPVEVELPSRTVVIALPIVGQAVVAQDHAGPAAFNPTTGATELILTRYFQ